VRAGDPLSPALERELSSWSLLLAPFFLEEEPPGSESLGLWIKLSNGGITVHPFIAGPGKLFL